MARNRKTTQALASQSADRLKAVAANIKPLARSARVTSAHLVHATRKWGAPRVERAGQVLQDSVAPKAASVLSSAAQRLDPGKPQNGRWRTRAGIATLTAAASAAAALVFRRRKPRAAPSPAEPENDAATAQMSDTSATVDADADSQGEAS